jgi:hypothetical protein
LIRIRSGILAGARGVKSSDLLTLTEAHEQRAAHRRRKQYLIAKILAFLDARQ